MRTNLPPDDQPPASWRRMTSDAEAVAALPEPALDDPVSVSIMFCNALRDPRANLNALRFLTTPESHAAWGDFTSSSEFLKSIEDCGYGSQVNRAEGAPDVAYFKILRGVTQSYQVLDEQPVLVAAVLTLVWRPERGQWLVHSIGEPLLPEQLPRTAK
ncbi:MAG TPA: hypothetical protein VF174_02085 [Micromonosporaceae bacterium]